MLAKAHDPWLERGRFMYLLERNDDDKHNSLTERDYFDRNDSDICKAVFTWHHLIQIRIRIQSG